MRMDNVITILCIYLTIMILIFFCKIFNKS